MNLPLVVPLGLAILAVWYSLQALFALLYAGRAIGGETSILKKTFGGLPQAVAAWGTIMVLVFCPLTISWISSVADIILDLDIGRALHTGCVALLSVLVTLEISRLYDFALDRRGPWHALLFSAAIVDTFSLAFVGALLKYLAQTRNPPSWNGLEASILIVGLCALLSSLSILLFVRKAEENR